MTGATSGLGAAIASRLAKEGFSVYGTGRSVPAKSGDGAAGAAGAEGATRAGDKEAAAFPRYLSLDLRSEKSIASAVSGLIAREGRIDLLVACAGMGVAGAVEDTGMDDIALQMDVNFLGTVRTVKACLEGMRKQGGGKIVVIGSLAGRTGMPYQAFYSSSKFALEGFVESLRYEVHPFHIDVCIIEPGDFRTGFTGSRKKASSVSGAYGDSFSRVIAIQEHDERNGAFPEEVAAVIASLAKRKSMPLRMSVGPLFQRAAIFVKRLLPSKLFELVYRIYYKLD